MLLAGFALVLVALSVWLTIRSREGELEKSADTSQRIDARAPSGIRIKVEVLNASTVRGLARRATMHLRDRGFDVVAVGTSRDRRDSTLVLDRSGHPDWARLVGDAMGGAAVEARPDTSRYLDVTVLVGASWRPPPEPFYP